VELLREDGTILYINPAVTRVLGFEPQELIGTNAFDLVHPQDRTRLQQELAELLAQGGVEGEVSAYRCRDTHGRWRWFKSTGSLLDYQTQPRAIIVHSRDITEQEESRQALIKANLDMSTIWESMSDALVAVDNQWLITHLNSAAANLVQQSPTQLIGRTLWEVYPEAVDSSFSRYYHHAVQEQVEVTFEEFYPPFNRWFEVHAYPSEAGLAVYFRDITRRK
ncbi:MAG: PAS domain S-box protein, partial [Cytophagaceae bacterium]